MHCVGVQRALCQLYRGILGDVNIFHCENLAICGFSAQ